MRALSSLLFVASFVFADEPQPDLATIHLPADAFFVVRVAAPERFDAIGRDLPLLAQLAEERRPLGDAIFEDVPAMSLVDRSQPIYFAIGGDGARTTLARAREGVTAEQVEALGKRRSVRLRLLADGWIRESSGTELAEAPAPFAILPGDVSLCVPVAAIVEKNRAKIDEAFARLGKIDEMAAEQGVAVPPTVMKFVRLLGGKVLTALTDVADVHYALAWRGGRLESEGWIRTLERSALRKWLEARKGTKPNGLMDLFPGRAFWMVESAGTASALDGDVAALLDEAFGAGMGNTLLLLLSPSYALHDHLTGQAAGIIMVQGLMAMNMRAIHEVKPEAPIAEAIAALDVTKINRLTGGLLDAKIERGFAKAGDTPMHRITFWSEIPQAGMWIGQMTTCFAVEGKYLLVAQSAMAENELRALILQVRSGERTTHPHTKAMERLMPDRQEGLSMNVGMLKPLLGLAAMFLPEVAQVVNAVPDDLWLSTALAVRDGNVHFRGDWPLKEVLDFAGKVKAMDLRR